MEGTLSVWVNILEGRVWEAAAWAYVTFTGSGYSSKHLFHTSRNDTYCSTWILCIAISRRWIGQSSDLDAWASEQLTHWTGCGQFMLPWSSVPHTGQVMSHVQRVCACPDFFDIWSTTLDWQVWSRMLEAHGGRDISKMMETLTVRDSLWNVWNSRRQDSKMLRTRVDRDCFWNVRL
jgi:hypothetical protein